MYPKTQQRPSSDLVARVNLHNPEASAQRGLWSNEYPNEVDHTGTRAMCACTASLRKNRITP